MRRLIFFMLASASASFGQLDSNSITIQASRALDNVRPDVAILGVSVSSKLSAGLDEVVAALPGTGITSANLAGVNASETSLAWSFSLSVPFASLKNTIATLSTLQGNISGQTAKQSGGLTLSFSVDGSEASTQLLAAQTCPIPDLINDARTQARKLTDAAGMGLGPILALADSQGEANATTYTVLYTKVLGAVTNFTRFQGFLFSGSTPCTLTVKFGLLRN